MLTLFLLSLTFSFSRPFSLTLFLSPTPSPSLSLSVPPLCCSSIPCISHPPLPFHLHLLCSLSTVLSDHWCSVFVWTEATNAIQTSCHCVLSSNSVFMLMVFSQSFVPLHFTLTNVTIFSFRQMPSETTLLFASEQWKLFSIPCVMISNGISLSKLNIDFSQALWLKSIDRKRNCLRVIHKHRISYFFLLNFPSPPSSYWHLDFDSVSLLALLFECMYAHRNIVIAARAPFNCLHNCGRKKNTSSTNG